MYETPKSALIEAENESLAYKIVKGINILLLVAFIGDSEIENTALLEASF